MLDSPRTLSEGLRLDRQFRKAVYEVEQRVEILNRQAAMRVRHWLHHLRMPTQNLIWKRNRNQHCHVLLYQLGKGRLTQPFDREPADGPVGNLPSHVLAEWKSSLRTRTGSKMPQTALEVSPAMGSVPNRCLPEPPPLHNQDPGLSKLIMPPASAIHRRSASPQATLHRCSEACIDSQALIPAHRHSSIYRTHLQVRSSADASQMVQDSPAKQDTTAIQHAAGCGCTKEDASLHLYSCDMHRKVQQCEYLLKQHMHEQWQSTFRGSALSRRPPSQVKNMKLAVPDIQVHLKGIKPKLEYSRTAVSVSQAGVDGIGQITKYKAPPTFAGATSGSARSKISAPHTSSMDDVTECQGRSRAAQEGKELLGSHSSTSSFDDEQVASLSISKDSFSFDLDNGSPQLEQKRPLSMHPTILRAHLDKMQLAEQDMLRSCAARLWH